MIFLLKEKNVNKIEETRSITKTDNDVHDWIFRGDFDWSPNEANRVRFGASYTLHSFLPARTTRNYTTGSTKVITRDSTWAYSANEANVYVEDDWRVSDHIRVNAGFHGSLFNIDRTTHFGYGPRLSASYRPMDGWAFKAAMRTSTRMLTPSQCFASTR